MARILIVEDEAIIALDMARQLKQLGHTVVGMARTGEAAIVEAARSTPDVILMDVRLQGSLDGIETASRILMHQAVPIIYLTAFTDEATAQRMQQTRHAGHLAKPFMLQAVHQAIQDVVRRQ